MSKCDKLVLGFSALEREAHNNFKAGLEDVKPALFNMTEQLVETFPQKKWNLLLGDDASARLPVRFVRHVFKQLGEDIPVRYIAAGNSVKSTKPISTYESYSEGIAQAAGSPNLLLITETASSFESIRFIRNLFQPHCNSVDIAVIASRFDPPDNLGEIYSGAVGSELAMDAVWRTFENPTFGAEGQDWGGAVNNLENNYDPDQAFAKITDNKSYSLLAHYGYTLMPEFAAEFIASR